MAEAATDKSSAARHPSRLELAIWLAGDASQTQDAQLAEHVATCHSCSAALEELRAHQADYQRRAPADLARLRAGVEGIAGAGDGWHRFVVGFATVRLAASLPEDAFSDIDGDTVTISVVQADGGPLPSWLTFDPATLNLFGDPPEHFNGEIALQARAFDGTETTTRDFLLEIEAVNDAPRLGGAFSDRFATEDTPFDITLQQGLFTDAEGDPLTYAITLADDGPLPGWLVADTTALTLSGQAPASWSLAKKRSTRPSVSSRSMEGSWLA